MLSSASALCGSVVVWSSSSPLLSSHRRSEEVGDPSHLIVIKIILRFEFLHVAFCGIYEIGFLPLLFDNSEEIRWIGSLDGNFDEGGDDIYGVNNFFGATTWRIRFLDGYIEAGMVSLSWNKFLQIFFVLSWSDPTTVKVL